MHLDFPESPQLGIEVMLQTILGGFRFSMLIRTPNCFRHRAPSLPHHKQLNACPVKKQQALSRVHPLVLLAFLLVSWRLLHETNSERQNPPLDWARADVAIRVW